MTDVFRVARGEDVHAAAARLFDVVRAELAALLPFAEVLHVGSTAIPGATTKGDLDVQVRVPGARFDEACRASAARWAVNDGGFTAPDGCSFEDKSTTPELGVHVTVTGSAADFQWVYGAMMIEDPSWVADYDALKVRFDGRSMDEYRDEKDRFFAVMRGSPRFDALRRAGPR